ncbi:FRAT-87 protein, partial [uncultured Faecalibaculum sp.]
TKDEMIAKLTPAIGDTAYGKELIAALEATFDDADKKYGQDALDRLHDRLGFLEYYMKRDAEMGEEAKSAAEADKLAIVKKAAAALQ